MEAVLEEIDHIHVPVGTTMPATGASVAMPGSTAVRGTVFVTNYRMFFVPVRRVVARWCAHGSGSSTGAHCPCPPAGFALPLAAVERIDRTRALEGGRLVCCLVVRTKLLHALRLQYAVPAARSELPTLPDALLERLVFHSTLRRLFAFAPAWVASFRDAPAPFRYDAAAEYARMGLPSPTWAVGRFNPGYTRCATYPEVLCFPSSFVYGGLFLELLCFHHHSCSSSHLLLSLLSSSPLFVIVITVINNYRINNRNNNKNNKNNNQSTRTTNHQQSKP